MAKWGKVDYKQLERLRDELEKFQKVDIDKFCRDMAKELAARLLAKVVKRTPVGVYESGSGKVGGTLRRGWTAESDKAAMYAALFGGGTEAAGGTGSKQEVYGKGAVSENIKGNVNSMEVLKKGNDYIITIINPVLYASYVEFGHRTSNHKGWVPGRFMLTISEKEIKQTAPKLIEKKLYQKLKEVFENAT